MSNQLRSEMRAYDYMLQRFEEIGNTKMVRKLKEVPVSLTHGTPAGYLALRDEGMHSLGIGTMHHMRSVISGIFIPSLQFKGYTMQEKFNLWRGKAAAGVSANWDVILATDLSATVPELEIPVYFLQGIYDYTCSYDEAKIYFAKLKAPVKGFYTFQYSAHSPIFEEPGKARKIFKEDVLAGETRLADKAISLVQ
jgi:pimeloyl-ACP methyl ester carboxylesterase